MKEERVIETTLCTPYKPRLKNDNSLHLDTTLLFQKGIRRAYSKIVLTGDDSYDKIKLKQFEKKLKYIITSKDTTNGIQMVFGDRSKYKYFIGAIDVCYKCDSFPLYAIYTNNLWAGYWKRSKESIDRSRIHLKERLESDKRNRDEKALFSNSVSLTNTQKFNLSILVVMFLILGFLSIRKTIK